MCKAAMIVLSSATHGCCAILEAYGTDCEVPLSNYCVLLVCFHITVLTSNFVSQLTRHKKVI